MRDVTSQNFGLLIAYVLPGLLALWGLSALAPPLESWLRSCIAATTDPVPAGAFIYLLFASIAAGITVSTIRWAVIDRLHHYTGLQRPAWDDAKLQERLAAFEALVDAHYRYYQFYANSFVALLFVFIARSVCSGRCLSDMGRLDFGTVFLCVIYWAGSRDTLRNYYTRAAFLLGTNERTVCHDERSFPRHRGSRHRNTRRKKAASKAGSGDAAAAKPAARRNRAEGDEKAGA